MKQIYNTPALGTYLIEDGDMELVIDNAVKLGYRNFDSASFYKNERSFGSSLHKAILESGLSRSDFFVSTKVWVDAVIENEVVASVESSIDDIFGDFDNCDRYVDIVYIHWPSAGHVNAYKTLVDMIKQKKTVKYIGLSNYLPQHWTELVNGVSPKELHDFPPLINQIELNVSIYDKETVDFFLKKDILIMAYKPLGRGGVFKNDSIQNLAESENCTVVKLCLSWIRHKNALVAIKSSRVDRLKSNYDDYMEPAVLSDATILAIDLLAKNDVVVDDIHKKVLTANERLKDMDSLTYIRSKRN